MPAVTGAEFSVLGFESELPKMSSVMQCYPDKLNLGVWKCSEVVPVVSQGEGRGPSRVNLISGLTPQQEYSGVWG